MTAAPIRAPRRECDQAADAILASVDAILRYRAMRAEARLRPPTAVIGHMPFFDHRTVAQVREDEARKKILRELGR